MMWYLCIGGEVRKEVIQKRLKNDPYDDADELTDWMLVNYYIVSLTANCLRLKCQLVMGDEQRLNMLQSP